MKKVLIPTLRFPPAGGVGLRRIIKMGKKMAEKNVEVHYITTNNTPQINAYTGDIKHPNIYIKKIPSLSLSNYLTKYKEGIFEKIFSKLIYYLTLPLFFVDYATLWGFILIPYVCWYAKKNNIKNIYVSGAPFSTIFHMSILKKYFLKKIFLISEWRDYWTDDYGRRYIPPQNISKKIQVCMEKFSIDNSDIVIGVTPTLLKSLQKDGNIAKYKLIENGFDKDDFDFSIEKQNGLPNEDKYVVCYTGNIVDTRAEGLFLFLDFLKRNKQYNITFELCGELGYFIRKKIYNEYMDLIDNKVLIYHGLVSVQEALQIVQRSDYGLVLVQRQHPEALTSKFFEYCYAQKPIIAIGPRGDLQNKMDKIRVGLFCELDNIRIDVLNEFIKNAKLDNMEFDMIISKNDFSFLASLLEKELK